MTMLTKALLRTGGQKEKDNMVWNMIGSFCYAFASMVLSFLVMRLIGEEEGGIFSFGYSTFGQQMFILAYFGIRPFQITDGQREYSFGDYLHHRILTCLAAVIVGGGYLIVCGYLLPERYSIDKVAVLFLLVCYKVVDGFADVFESEFQRNGNLHLTGKSNTFRTLLTVGTFLISLTAGRNLLFSCLVAVGAQILGVLLFNICVIKELTEINYHWERRKVYGLFGSAALLFISVFLDFYIFSSSKYAIDAHMNDAYSGYFNIIFMPTSIINLAAGFVIRPFLTYLTGYWNQKRYEEFFRMIRKLVAIIGGLSVAAVVGTVLIGHPVLLLLEGILGDDYTGKLSGYQLPFVLIVAGGGCYAMINLLYYILVILRKQKLIFVLYAIMTALAAVIAPYFVIQAGIFGAARGYLLLMVLMAAAFAGGTWMAISLEKNKK